TNCILSHSAKNKCGLIAPVPLLRNEGAGSEDNLQRKLHLARRARLACRKSRLPDHTECCTARCRHEARISEVRVIEKIKDLRAKLRANRFSDPRVLEDREVDIVECRSSDGIPPEITEV